VLNEDQAGAIIDLYETPTQSSRRYQAIGIYVLVGIAALFVGLAAFLLIGYNWENLPDPLKLMIVFGAVAAAHGFGFVVRYVWQAKIFSEFAFFLGCLFYGGAIVLVAEIFHLHSHPPDGVWWWAIGVLPFALFLDTVLIHLLVATLLAVWVGMELLGGGFGPDVARFGVLPRLALSLPILAGLGLCWAYQKKSPTAAGLYVPVVAWWLVLLPFAWHWREFPILFIGSVGALMLIIAEVHAEGNKLAVPYRLYGSLLCMGVLSVLSFREVHRELARMTDVWPFILQSLLITAVSGIVFGVAFVIKSQRAEAAYLRPVYAYALRQWLPLSMALLMFVLTLYYAALKNVEAEPMIALVPTALGNIGMLILAFWLMMRGLREERGFPSAGGVLFFLLWSVFRYAEWFGSRGGMLGGACMFFVCGATIFAFAMFWHVRKRQRERSSHERE
jgi:uncharacterized membrane protein